MSTVAISSSPRFPCTIFLLWKQDFCLFSAGWIEGTNRAMTSTAGPSYAPAPKPKSRRSGRRCRLRSNTSDTDPQSLSTLGYFQTLPLEIFQMVLNYLPGENTIRTVLIPISENYHKSFLFGKCHYCLKCLTFSYLKSFCVTYSLNFQLLCMKKQMTKI